MPFNHLPAQLSAWLCALSDCLDRRSAPLLLLLLSGALFARGRRTVTSWLRAGGITTEFRRAYNALFAAGRRARRASTALLLVVLRPLMRQAEARGERLLFAIDDTPTKRYGPCVQGAGLHHNPTPGPAGQAHCWGHLWVTLAWLARHPACGALALPLRAALYVRHKDVPRLREDYPDWAFRTKLELAVELVRWLLVWLAGTPGKPAWVVADGAYAKAPFLRPLSRLGVVVVSRLRKDAALLSVPPPRRPGQRGRPRAYGQSRISLARRAGQRRGWQQVGCVLYGKATVKAVKTFTATYRPAGPGAVLRVVLVKEERQPRGWVAFFCTDAAASAAAVLEAVAARTALEQTFKGVKEVWGAQQQQVRNVYACVGCFHLNLWLYTLTEAWAWDRPVEDVVDRGRCPWDNEPRRPSHADKRKALQREVLRGEIDAALAGRPTKAQIRALTDSLLALAA